MKIKDLATIAGNGLQYLITWSQVEDIARITGLVLSIMISVLIIIDKVITWWKKAKADGKITKDEIDELGHIMSEGVNDIKEHLESSKDSKKGEK